MSASLPIPFAVGSKAWHAHVASDGELVECPSCAGTLKHSVTLGNGETHEVFCRDCGAEHAFDYDYDLHENRRTAGRVTRYRVRVEVREVTLADCEVRGDEITYHDAGRSYFYARDLFATEAEARAHAEKVLQPAAQKEADDRFHMMFTHGRRTKAKDAGWSAAFWADKRKETVERLAGIDRRLERIKALGSKPRKRSVSATTEAAS